MAKLYIGRNSPFFFMLMFRSAYSVSHLTHCNTPLLVFVVIFMLFNVKGETIFMLSEEHGA